MKSPPDAVYASVRDIDPDTLDSDELDAYLGQVADLKAWCDAREVRATRRQRRLAAAGRATDPRDSLAKYGRRGQQSVDAFARNCRDLARTIRAHENARADVDELEQQREQSKISRWVDRQTGMHKTLIECDPISDRQIWAAIQRERGKLRRRSQQHGTNPSWGRLTVDSLVEAVSSAPGAGDVSRARPSLVVHIDVATLTTGRHPDSLCETDSGAPVPVETARRLRATPTSFRSSSTSHTTT